MNIVIITGGSRGIGAATALGRARYCLGVIITYNNPDAAAAVVDKINADGAGR